MPETVNQKLFNFIDRSPTAFHAVENAAAILQAAGFAPLCEGQSWSLSAGGKYYVTRGGTSLIAFTVPKKDFGGFQIVAAHSDSPCFKVKENAVIRCEKHYTKLNTECYGGMILSSWLDRPLSLAGRVMVKTAGGISARLINIDRDLLVIPSLAIHLQRDWSDGHKFNPQIDMLPLLGDENSDLSGLIAKAAGAEKDALLSCDLYLYPREKGRLLGGEEEFILSPRLDDLQCAFASLTALTESDNAENMRVCAIFDSEEVGSGTKQGAGSTMLFDVLVRANECLGRSDQQYRMALWNSFMLSADNAHAVHPNYADKYDSSCRSYLNRGVVIKFNANQKYTTDAVSASVFGEICKKAQVPVQVFHNRSDMPGGSTLGNISSGRVSLSAVDIGVPQLAMHSAVETAGAKDSEYMVQAMTAFYNAVIRQGQGGYQF